MLCKAVCQPFPLDSLLAGLRPALSSALRFGWKIGGVARVSHVSMRGRPKTAVIPVMAVMLPAASCKDNLPSAILPLIVILDAVLIKERGAILVEPFRDDRGQFPAFPHDFQKLRSRARPSLPALHERHHPKKDRGNLCRRKLLLCLPFYQLPAAITETERQLLIGRVPASDKKLRRIGCAAFLFQNKGSVRTPCQACRARHLVEHVAVILLADVVDDHHRKGMPVGKIFQQRYIPIIVCIGVVFGCGTDFLQRVNDNQPALGICFEVIFKLHDKTVWQLAACHGKVEPPARFVRQTEQPVLYAAERIFQTQVKHVALQCLHIP